VSPVLWATQKRRRAESIPIEQRLPPQAKRAPRAEKHEEKREWLV
jgi:hypothetical protein